MVNRALSYSNEMHLVDLLSAIGLALYDNTR